MKLHLIITITVFILFVSCDNIIKRANQQVDDSIKNSKIIMDSDFALLKQTFREAFEVVSKSSKCDSSISQKIIRLYSNINETSDYIDSLKFEINKLDYKDVQSSELIKKMFLNDGIGDSVINKVKLSYTQAIDVALNDTTRLNLKIVQNKYTTETKKQFFEMNSVLGSNMILYGIQSELIIDATKVLCEFKRK